jgi:hypothetical protein
MERMGDILKLAKGLGRVTPSPHYFLIVWGKALLRF